jgi:hypothetical protein
VSRRLIEARTCRWVLWLEPQRARLLAQARWPSVESGAWTLHRDLALPALHEGGWAAAVEGVLGDAAASWRRVEVALAGSLAVQLPLSLGHQRLPRRVRQAFAEARVHEWFHEPAGAWQVRLPGGVMRGDTVACAVRQPVLQAVLHAVRRAALVQPAAWWAAQQLQPPTGSGELRWMVLAEADRCTGVLWQGLRPVHCVLLPAVDDARPGASWWQALDAWEARVAAVQGGKPAVMLARLDGSPASVLQAPGRQASAFGLLAPAGALPAGPQPVPAS